MSPAAAFGIESLATHPRGKGWGSLVIGESEKGWASFRPEVSKYETEADDSSLCSCHCGSLPDGQFTDLMVNATKLAEMSRKPKSMGFSIRDYVCLPAPELKILRAIGEESKRNGTTSLTSRQIDQIIKIARGAKLMR
jgi:hypothetical protein